MNLFAFSSSLVRALLHVCLMAMKRALPDDKDKLKRKVEFTRASLRMRDPFKLANSIPEDVESALKWQAGKSSEQVIREREATLCYLEATGKSMWDKGLCEAWFADCTDEIRAVSCTVNGPLLAYLASSVGYCDQSCVEFFRKGAPLYGELEHSGALGAPKDCTAEVSVDALRADCQRSNVLLVESLREDEFSKELMELTRQDAAMDRMTPPRPITECDMAGLRLCPRFGVEQGLRPDGTQKVRAVDNLSFAAREGDGRISKKAMKAISINGQCAMHESISHDHLDDLFEAMRRFIVLMGTLPGLWKADIDAAFRRIPLMTEHYWAAVIAFIFNGEVMISAHRASPFGAASSVHAWERIGALICKLARKYLHMAVFRYVDDFFAPERPDVLEHAMHCFARLVRLLLGSSAIAARKLECGRSLVILGVQISLEATGYCCRPAAEKALKCIAVMEEALSRGVLHSGCAQKLAGRLSWASQFLFKRLGRAMIRPIFGQQYSRSGKIPVALRVALRWWIWVLKHDIVEECAWGVADTGPVHLFVDARGVPPRCAAVLCVDGEILYTDGAPAQVFMDALEDRSDNQIMSLETIAIAVGLSTFARELAGRKVIIFSDNTGAEAATKKGTAHSWDHCCLIHEIWSFALLHRMGIWIERVPSDDNISDLPSRESHALLKAMGAVWRPPLIAKICVGMPCDGCFVGRE